MSLNVTMCGEKSYIQQSINQTSKMLNGASSPQSRTVTIIKRLLYIINVTMSYDFLMDEMYPGGSIYV